ncbi:hypothetical protein [Jatrophihabitans fulvus]
MTATVPPAARPDIRPIDIPAEPHGTVVPASTGLRRRALGVAVIAGSVLTVAGFATTVWEVDETKLSYLNSLDVNPTQSQIAALLLHFGYMAFAAALLVLAAMTRGLRSKFVTVALGVAGAGAVTLPGLLVTDFYDLAIRQTLPDDQAVATSDKASEYGLGAVMAVPAVFGLVLGLIAVMIAAARARKLHWSVPPVFAVGFFVPVFLGAQGWVVNTGGAAVAFGALAFVGVKALRMSDEQWVTGTR